MNKINILATILVLGVVISLAAGCGTKATTTTKTQTYTVQKGSISESVTGTGNLALSKTEDLAFEMAGYVESVDVEEGETVKEGQELAKLDTTEWKKQLKTYQQAVETAQRTLSSKQQTLAAKLRAVTTAENNVTKAQRTVTEKEFAVTTAEIAVISANNSLNSITKVKKIQDDIDNANYAIKLSQSMLISGGDYSYWNGVLVSAQSALSQDNADMKDLLNGSTTTSADVALQIAQKVNALEQANLNLEDAQIAVNEYVTAVATAQQAVTDAKYDLANAQMDVNDATDSVTEAQSDMDDANTKSPIITAPFDGFISSVKVAGGDEVYKGSVAMTIADPNQFSAKISVTEDDIFSIKLGGEATVAVGALSDETFPATVIKISPTATVSSGVVSFSVTVNLTSMTPVTTTTTSLTTISQLPGQSANRTMPSGIPTGTMPSTKTSGNSTVPMMGNSGNFTAPSMTPQTTQSAATTATSSNVSLKAGLSATVNIISQQKTNILIIPSKAITRVSGQSTVQVVNGSITETRVIQTDMTDGSYTEITSGLTEGEKIQLKTTSSTSSSSSTTKTVSAQQQLQSLSGGGPSGGGPPGGGF
jgi:HlyD family secretion protein